MRHPNKRRRRKPCQEKRHARAQRSTARTDRLAALRPPGELYEEWIIVDPGQTEDDIRTDPHLAALEAAAGDYEDGDMSMTDLMAAVVRLAPFYDSEVPVRAAIVLDQMIDRGFVPFVVADGSVKVRPLDSMGEQIGELFPASGEFSAEDGWYAFHRLHGMAMILLSDVAATGENGEEITVTAVRPVAGPPQPGTGGRWVFADELSEADREVFESLVRTGLGMA